MWPPQSCDLTTPDYYLWGAVKENKTIDAFKDNIREAIGEIQLSVGSCIGHFDLGGYVNKQNCHIWGTKKPTRIH